MPFCTSSGCSHVRTGITWPPTFPPFPLHIISVPAFIFTAFSSLKTFFFKFFIATSWNLGSALIWMFDVCTNIQLPAKQWKSSFVVAGLRSVFVQCKYSFSHGFLENRWEWRIASQWVVTCSYLMNTVFKFIFLLWLSLLPFTYFVILKLFGDLVAQGRIMRSRILGVDFSTSSTKHWEWAAWGRVTREGTRGMQVVTWSLLSRGCTLMTYKKGVPNCN